MAAHDDIGFARFGTCRISRKNQIEMGFVTEITGRCDSSILGRHHSRGRRHEESAFPMSRRRTDRISPPPILAAPSVNSLFDIGKCTVYYTFHAAH